MSYGLLWPGKMGDGSRWYNKANILRGGGVGGGRPKKKPLLPTMELRQLLGRDEQCSALP
jgi:hypothetical protein